MKLKKRLILFIFLVGSYFGKAQLGLNCSSALSLTISPGQNTGWQTTSYDTLWFQFTAINDRVAYDIFNDTLYNRRLSEIILYPNCSVQSDYGMLDYINDSTTRIFCQGLTIGNTYYFGLVFKNNFSCGTCFSSLMARYNIEFILSLPAYIGCTNNTICNSTPVCEYICNGSFEINGGDNGGIPQNYGEIEKACGWKSANISLIGYYNTSSPTSMPSVAIPNNSKGCESERTSQNNYASFRPGYYSGSNHFNSALYTKLKTPLINGVTYKISFYLSLADRETLIQWGHVGFAFANNYTQYTADGLNFNPYFNLTQVNTNNLSKNGWTNFTYNYTANGTETDFLIGYFGDNNLNTFNSPANPSCNIPPPVTAGVFTEYYLDDISIQAPSIGAVSVVLPTSCSGFATLTASGGTSYVWQPGGFTGNPLVTSLNNVTFTVTAIGACATSNTTAVYVPPFSASPCLNEHITGTNITIPVGSSFSASGIYTGYNFTCLGNIIVPNNMTANFNNCTFMMGPGTQINMGLKSTLNIDNSHLYGCTSMWKGISMQGQVGGNLTLTKTVLEDAYWGIWVPAAGSTSSSNNFPNSVKVSNCLFNTNYIDINYNNNITNTIDVNNTIFTSRCLNYDPPTVGATIPNNFTNTSYVQANIAPAPFVAPPPYISGGITTYYTSPYVGLELNRFSSNNLPGIGNQITLTTRNIFDYHTIGIETLNFSNLKIENQVFTNGLGNAFTDKTGYGSIGIYAHNINWTVTNNAYIGNVTIGGSAATANIFTALDYGIYALGGGTADSRYTIRNNDFKKIKQNGITFMNYNSLVNNVPTRLIQNNKFNEVNAWGIYMLNSVTTFALLNNNNFTNPGAPAIYTRYGGIYVGEIKNPSTAKYFITQNTMNNIVTGIKCENLSQLASNYNNIQLSPQSNINSNLGYHLVNCLKPSITRNNITGNTTPSNVNIDQGIYVQDCSSGYYTCNNFKNTFIGSQFSGQNVSTTLFENTYDYNLAGIYLTKQGFIDVQDDPIYPGQPVDNKFLNYGASQYNSYCATTGGFSTNGAASPFYVRNSPNFYDMTINGADNLTIPNSFPLQINIVSSPFPQTNTFCNGTLSNAFKLTNMANQIVNPGIYNATLVRDNITSRRQLYKVLENITAPNGMLTAFKNSSVNNSIGQFAIIDSLTTEFSNTGNTSKLIQAQSLNSSVLSTTTIDGYQKQLNNLFVSYLSNNSLSGSEIGQLQSIAALCPHTDGTSVWEARTFIKLFDSAEYVNVCELQTYPMALNNTSRMAKTTVSETVNSKIKGQLIPNPNNGNFSIVMNEYIEDLKAEVYDVNGKFVCSNVAVNNNRVDILCNELTNGVYFVKVFISKVYNETHRLIITK